ncbi:PIN domain-containing protein [Candidatus Woesearchaeota archaeon]|nr:PIN domain-containing protein [Candidatus Woesearchaeota archaeon]
MRYFFDTYAFFEIINGNPKYEIYVECDVITTIFNLAELNYGLKKKMSKELSEKYTDKYYQFVVEVTIDDIKNAMDLKTIHKHLSIQDVIGYTIAKKYNVKLLTGDKDFEGMENVEFVN